MAILLTQELLRLEPLVFVDALAAGTIRASASNAEIAGATLRATGLSFIAFGVTSDDVAVVQSQALEIRAVSVDTLEVTRPRASDAEPTVPPGDRTGASMSIVSFASLIERVEEGVLHDLGIDETALTSDSWQLFEQPSLKELIAARVIQYAFEIAAAGDLTQPRLTAQAALWGKRAAAQRASTSIVLDLDGDGEPDATRRAAVITLRRT